LVGAGHCFAEEIIQSLVVFARVYRAVLHLN
jgi:hypothetical protein